MSSSDEAFARAVNQMGAATIEHIENAKAAQAESARKGVPISLADAMIQLGMLTPIMRESIEKKLKAQASGGIQQLGQYKLLKKLGEGGMGAVYLAEDLNVGRKVALKVLPKRFAVESEFLTRFKREAQATGKLNHVNIVAAYASGEDLGHHYYAMEFCDGEPLDAILKRDKVVAPEKALAIAMQVARGLKHAHDHGFVHRDIKPGNVFVTRSGIAKILDLGLSKDISDSQKSFNTQTGVALGTPHYISPEQARGDRIIDGRTDIYSLGAMFYHLVTGETPFQGSTAALIMMKHLNDQLPNPQDINDRIPDAVVLVIQIMMAKDPADRYRNCAELLADLERVNEGQMPNRRAVEAGKSSVAMRQKQHPARRAPTRGTQQHQPVGARQNPDERKRPARAKSLSNNQMYLMIGGLGVGVVILAVATMSGGKPQEPAPRSDAKPLEAATATQAALPNVKTPTPVPPSISATPSSTATPAITATSSSPANQPEAAVPVKEMSLNLGGIGGGVKMELVLVNAGEFSMGEESVDVDEKPVHKVKIGQPFYIGKYNVTVGQFRAFADAANYRTEAEKMNKGWTVKDGKWRELPGVNWRNPGFAQDENHPACVITWADAQAFVAWTSKQTGREVRLPTEAQWEYAARGPGNRKYPWGDNWESNMANVADASLRRAGFNMQYGETSQDDGYPFTSPGGAYKNASWCGAYDMSGNVWQWCQDYYGDKYYAESPAVDPPGPAFGSERVMRGGCWHNAPADCRSGRRNSHNPGGRLANRGFRVAIVGAPLELLVAENFKKFDLDHLPPQWVADRNSKPLLSIVEQPGHGKVLRIARHDGDIIHPLLRVNIDAEKAGGKLLRVSVAAFCPRGYTPSPDPKLFWAKPGFGIFRNGSNGLSYGLSPTQNEWTEVTGSSHVPRNATDLRVSLHLPIVTGEVFFDDFRIWLEPDPKAAKTVE